MHQGGLAAIGPAAMLAHEGARLAVSAHMLEEKRPPSEEHRAVRTRMRGGGVDSPDVTTKMTERGIGSKRGTASGAIIWTERALERAVVAVLEEKERTPMKVKDTRDENMH